MKKFFNFAAGCTGSALLGGGAIMLFPVMPVLATVMGVASLAVYLDTMEQFLAAHDTGRPQNATAEKPQNLKL